MLPASVRIFICTEPQDMRRSFDGLALATMQVLRPGPALWRTVRLSQQALQPSRGLMVGHQRLLPALQKVASGPVRPAVDAVW